MQVYNVGVIGCGRIASLLEQETHRGTPNTHAGCYDHCDRTRIIATADRDDERRQSFGGKWDVPGLYTDWQEMLDTEKLDIVSVCTYPIPHRDIVVAAAQSGVKAIFCEKAMATTLREADEMIDACRRNNVKLSINHTRRWDWQFRQIKELIDQEVIGSLQAMTLQYSAGLANNGTHFFDMLRFFAGDVAWATGHLLDPDALDPRGAGYFQFQNGVQCIVNGSTGGRAQHLFELIGSRGRITVDNTHRFVSMSALWKYAKGRITVVNTPPRQFKLFVKNKEEKFPEIPEEHKLNTTNAGRCVIPLSAEEIVESLDRDQDTISTGEDGRAALEMVLALHESERLGNARVDFPMTNLDLQVLVRDEGFMSSAVPQK